MRIYSDSDVPIVVVSKVKLWVRNCSHCGWKLEIRDYLQPHIAHIPCPKCGETTDLIER